MTAQTTELNEARERIEASLRQRRNENARLRRAVRKAGHNIDGMTSRQVGQRFYIHAGQLVDMAAGAR